jgi:hypothetical protein
MRALAVESHHLADPDVVAAMAEDLAGQLGHRTGADIHLVVDIQASDATLSQGEVRQKACAGTEPNHPPGRYLDPPEVPW